MPATHDPSALLEAAMNGDLNLDTGAEHQGAGTDTATTAAEHNNTATTAEDGAPAGNDNGHQETEQPAPIASKSGAYTIPYEKLAEARTERDEIKRRYAELEEAHRQLTANQQGNLQQAQQEAQARAAAGEGATLADANLATAQAAMAQGVDMSLFGDFSEGDIAKGIKEMVLTQVQQALAPMQAKQQQEAKEVVAQNHYDAIYGAHPDADEVVQSTQWNDWLQKQPAFIRQATAQAMETGTPEQVIEVISTFKQNTGIARTGNRSVQAMLDNAQHAAPNTLTDVPGGLAAQSSAEQLSGVRDPASLLNMFEGKSSEEIERLMNLAV